MAFQIIFIGKNTSTKIHEFAIKLKGKYVYEKIRLAPQNFRILT